MCPVKHLFLSQLLRIQEGLQRGFAEAIPSGMRTLFIVFGQPLIQILLQFLQRVIQLPAKRRT
jgi:hypothetical protein